MNPHLNNLQGYFENISAIISMLLVIWRNHAALRFFAAFGFVVGYPDRALQYFFLQPPKQSQSSITLVKSSFGLWSRLTWPFARDSLCPVLLAVNELGKKRILLQKNSNPKNKKGDGRAPRRWFWFVPEACRAVSAVLAVALSQPDAAAGIVGIAELCDSCGIRTPWHWVFSLQPPRAIFHGLTWFTASPLPTFAGLRRAVVFLFFVRTLQSQRAHRRWWINAVGSLWSPTLGEAWCIFWSVSTTNSWVLQSWYHLL